MPRQTILISSLGESPAVVTEAIDKLEQEERIQFTQVITLGTNKYEVRQSAEVLSEHISAYYGGRIIYVPSFIEATDISDEKENLDYLSRLAELLRTYRHQGDVYVSLAGGRKTMSALMALAVQIYGARLLCHVIHLTLEMDEHLERKMHANYLSRYPEEQASLLHPPAEEVVLVRLPVISLFPLLNDLLNVLREGDVGALERVVQRLLEDSHLVEKAGAGWRVTDVGQKLYGILSDIELLPEPSTVAPQEKKVDLQDHHGKDQLVPHAERLRQFAYAERIVSTKWNSQFDHNQTIKTPHGRLFVETTSGQPDELRVTLADSPKGYALTIYTSAKSPSQAKRVKRELEKFLVNRGQ